MKKTMIALALSSAMLVSACSTNGGMSSGNAPPGSYCYEHTAVCVIGGVVVTGLVAGIAANSNNGNSGNNGCGPRGAHGVCNIHR
jgi:hypothetical protein